MASADPLDEDETVFVEGLLGGSEAVLFWEQPPADQRHAYRAARVVEGQARDRVDLARAALLHDVGKRHAQLGIFGRVLASLLRQVGLRGSGRIARYLDHPAIGGAELEEAGSDRLVIEFALHHHGDRPGTIQPDDWALLVAADHATGGRFAE
ncbi:MAG TPA: HD domain-containing protein [Acidimicrobiia bacterium]|nr:HD domain-containing protein [Acidimicrobiia bacterium]